MDGAARVSFNKLLNVVVDAQFNFYSHHRYLPEQRALWEVSLDKNRNLYNNLKTEFKICPTHTTEVMQEVDLVQALPPEDGGGIWRLDTDDKEPESGRKPVDDNPLQTDRDKSHWARCECFP